MTTQIFSPQSDTLKVLSFIQKVSPSMYWGIGGFNQQPPANLSLSAAPTSDMVFLPAYEILPAARIDSTDPWSSSQKQQAQTTLDNSWYLYRGITDTDYPYHSRVSPNLTAPLVATNTYVSVKISPNQLPGAFSILALFSHVILGSAVTGTNPPYSAANVVDTGLLHWIGSYNSTSITNTTYYQLFL